MRRSSRHHSTTILAAAIAIIAGCAGGEAPATPSATPAATPAAAVRPTPVAVPLTSETIPGAVAVLDSLASYRYTLRLVQGSFPESEVRGAVVNGDEPRSRADQVVDGEVAGSTITIGSRTWWSMGGSAYREQESGGGGEPWSGPLADMLDPEQLRLGRPEDLGIEARPTGPARHLRAEAVPDEPDPEFPDDFGWSPGYTGVADAWIDVAGGYLVEARFEGTRRPFAWDEDRMDEAPEPSPEPYAFEILVEGVDDPANVVDEPEVPAPTVLPSGDPAAAARIAGIAEGLAALDTYVFETVSSSGLEMTASQTVVNRPVPAVSMVTGGGQGFPGIEILVVGDRAWGRTSGQAWEQEGPPTCGARGSSEDMEPCTFERLTDLGASYAPIASTFTIAADHDLVAGIDCVRLRSEAGMPAGELTIPGTTELWIANDGGYLVRSVFTSTVFDSTTQITRIDDPTIVLEAPTR